MTVRKYEIVKSNYLKGFEEAINALISKGWEPHGSPSFLINKSGEIEYIQAMVLPK